MDDTLVECPYCGETYQPECEDFGEDCREEECNECGKTYLLSESFSVTHIATPDCELNGETHEYEDRSLGGGRTHPFCSKCSKCQPLNEIQEEPHA